MKNSLKSSYRFIVKSKIFTLINIIGLVLGLTISFFLLAYAINETSYNQGIPDHQTTVRWIFTDSQGNQFSLTPYPFADSLKRYPYFVYETTRLVHLPSMVGSVSVLHHGRYAEEKQFWAADTNFLTMFGLPVRKHTNFAEGTIADPVAISASTALRLFGKADPLGKTFPIQVAGFPFTLQVKQVYPDFPWNSTLKPEYIIPVNLIFKVLRTMSPGLDSVYNSMHEPFGETFSRLGYSALKGSLGQNMASIENGIGLRQENIVLSAQKVSDIYLGSDNIRENNHLHGDKESILIYTTLAFVVLLLAGINYSILSTARSALRYKEVGVRKVLGASRKDLHFQILTESVLLTFIAFPLALLLMGMVEPLFDQMAINQIHLYLENFWRYMLLFGSITLLIGLFSGVYVALFLGALNPLEALKAKLYPHKKFNISKIFIIFQLFITLGLLIGITTITRQILFCLSSNPGFDPANLLQMETNPSRIQNYPEFLKTIRNLPDVISVSGTSNPPPSNDSVVNFLNMPGRDSPLKYEIVSVDEGYFNTLGVPILSGKNFDTNVPANNVKKMIINQSLARELKENGPLGAYILDHQIIGVVRDFHLHTLHQRILPTMFVYNPEPARILLIRHRDGSTNEIASRIRTACVQNVPDLPLKFSGFDQLLTTLYKGDRNFGSMVGLMTLLSFLVTAMGLYGLALLLSERRTKETAIRKVYGASNFHINLYMQKEFLVYTAFASAFAVPVSAVVMTYWLRTFEYHVSPGWFTYAAAIIAVTSFVSLILYFRMRKVLRQNPVNALKYD